MARRFRNSLTALTLKAMGVFGGVQVLTILCSIVRNKLVAVWIGPVGVGLLAIYNTAMDMLSNAGQLNMRQSAVREVSAAPGAERPALVTAIRRIALCLGLGGMAVVLMASPLIGWFSFGTWSRWGGFAVLSLMMLFSAVAAAEMAIMQGMGNLRNLARVGLLTAVIATLLAIPLFYFWRLKAVVPVILCFSASQVILSLALRERVPSVRMSLRRAWQTGRPVITLGAWLTVSSVVTLLGSYVFLAWLNRTADTATMGMYQAGFTLVNSYVGIIFSALQMEYYPRLSAAVTRGPRRTSLLVTHESIVCMSVLIPVVVAFVLCSDLIVRILYASDFIAVVPFIAIAITGTLLKAQSWSIAYVILARGDGRMFIVSEVTSTAIGLTLNIAGWLLGGWMGLGISYVLWYALYLLIVYLIYRYRYGLKTHPRQWLVLLAGMVASAAAVAVKFLIL